MLYVAISTAGQRNFSSIAAAKDTQQTGSLAAITSGAAILVVESTTGWSVGDVVKVTGAGAAGADYYSTVLTVDSGIQATMNDNAGTTVSANAWVNAKQVTLTTSQGLNTGTTDTAWAIGGKRVSVLNNNSPKLVENNSSTGDAKPGWIIEMASGHTETISATKNVRCIGDSTTGPITIRGASGAATLPLITASNNGVAFSLRGGQTVLKNFEMRNSNATKTASIAVQFIATGGFTSTMGLKISHSTNKFWKGFVILNSDGTASQVIRDCEIGFCANAGIEQSDTGGGNSAGVRIMWNFVHDCGAGGIAVLGTGNGVMGMLIHGNIIYNITGIGIALNQARSSYDTMVVVTHNTIDTCTSDGLKYATTSALTAIVIANNISSNNGGYGFNFSAASFTAAYRDAIGMIVDGNNTYNNTTAAYNPSAFGSNDPALNPLYKSASGGDFSVTASLLRKAVPLAGSLFIGGGSATYSWGVPGAAQVRATPSASSELGI